ncbi:OsmC family protein [Actinotalea sp. M2MS4P-6]|uniref:OsmC family protein n=1 Tax=Actinotalea sp. M2MS4P-6 TaxID=2983762 RepID=UPI0021E3DD6B|nr:OsmC family protein [Actinotalea sp. M2MS4P-6]MCV2394779.1 OsmC family protein [Actinotalea sp. M2MS4P-6]
MSHRSLSVTRDSQGVYTARNAKGAEVTFGAEGFTPIEMLLAALAGCAAVDVDHATSRHAEPERFTVRVDAEKHTEGGNRLEDVVVTFDVAFGEGAGADRARAVLPRAVTVTHDRSCTVSGTLEAATPVVMRLA